MIEIKALFRNGLDTPIIAILLNKRFKEPIKALIGGFQSNLVTRVVWFKLKPNYFISINDPNIEDCRRLKLQTKKHSYERKQ